jgi:hypothetical protein
MKTPEGSVFCFAVNTTGSRPQKSPKILSPGFAWPFLINATIETSYLLNSLLAIISVQELRVNIVFLFCSFLKMTSIDKHQGRKMLFTKVVVS